MPISYSFGPGYTFATPRIVPYDFVEVDTPFATDSASFVDITGSEATITITDTTAIEATATVSWSAGASVVAGFRLLIDGSTDTGAEADSLPGNRRSSVPLLFAVEGLAPGTYVAKVQAKKVSGAGDITIDHVDLSLKGMQTE